jgi:hypothetical protein
MITFWIDFCLNEINIKNLSKMLLKLFFPWFYTKIFILNLYDSVSAKFVKRIFIKNDVDNNWYIDDLYYYNNKIIRIHKYIKSIKPNSKILMFGKQPQNRIIFRTNKNPILFLLERENIIYFDDEKNCLSNIYSSFYVQCIYSFIYAAYITYFYYN